MGREQQAEATPRRWHRGQNPAVTEAEKEWVENAKAVQVLSTKRVLAGAVGALPNSLGSPCAGGLAVTPESDPRGQGLRSFAAGGADSAVHTPEPPWGQVGARRHLEPHPCLLVLFPIWQPHCLTDSSWQRGLRRSRPGTLVLGIR